VVVYCNADLVASRPIPTIDNGLDRATTQTVQPAHMRAAIVSASEDKTARIFDAATGKTIAVCAARWLCGLPRSVLTTRVSSPDFRDVRFATVATEDWWSKSAHGAPRL